MITEKEKDIYAQLSGLSNIRYTDKVKEGVEQYYPYIQDEIAILRKQQSIILNWIKDKFGEDVALPEFTEYNSTIEKIKEQSKSDLSI